MEKRNFIFVLLSSRSIFRKYYISVSHIQGHMYWSLELIKIIERQHISRKTPTLVSPTIRFSVQFLGQ